MCMRCADKQQTFRQDPPRNPTRSPYSSTSDMLNRVFNKALRIKFAERSAKAHDAHLYDYIRDHVAKDVCDRVDDLTSKDKRLILNLGTCSGLIGKNINPDRVDLLVECDISRGRIRRSRTLSTALAPKFSILHAQVDEEQIPFKPEQFDLAISCLDLHWVDDLVSTFTQVHKTLRENSPFIGSLLGGDTLHELRSSLQLAEMERLPLCSNHCAPKTTGQDVAGLLQATGYRLITVDITEMKIRYPSMFELMFDIQGMGESNCAVHGSSHMNRDVMQAAAAIYQKLYGSDSLEDGVPATFHVIHFIGWKNPTKSTPLRSGQQPSI